MMESSPEEPRDSRATWSKSETRKLMSVLKNKRKIHLQEDGDLVYDNIKPQDHGIKKALLERPLLADTSGILQKLIVDILYTTTEKNVKELILTAMKKIKWETELFTKQLEKCIVEAEIKKKEDYRELTQEVEERDGNACLCCGVNTESNLQINHIKPLSLGGEISIKNSQVLCHICNKCKGKNEIDFRCNTTKLSIYKNLDLSCTSEGQKPISTLTRIVNFFYHCKAVHKITWDENAYTYNIYLYPNNNSEWLLQHKAELLKFFQDKLDRNAHNIEITTSEQI
ncbi:HNH endonuclease [Nostoc sp. LEGE 12447]|uniref:HNH endonuclease n=1 Tax=Nostoc sp. LEGE 12447 TaxID=1828640 RepID=UPI00188348E3|nr:HNH endonuclease [Nostoc sp. LEGE 12447]MBE8998244.1 HNH endonuclease [Nostoc sp. LEGE 12447]